MTYFSHVCFTHSFFQLLHFAAAVLCRDYLRPFPRRLLLDLYLDRMCSLLQDVDRSIRRIGS
jgi:hypothetical protein